MVNEFPCWFEGKNNLEWCGDIEDYPADIYSEPHIFENQIKEQESHEERLKRIAKHNENFNREARQIVNDPINKGIRDDINSVTNHTEEEDQMVIINKETNHDEIEIVSVTKGRSRRNNSRINYNMLNEDGIRKKVSNNEGRENNIEIEIEESLIEDNNNKNNKNKSDNNNNNNKEKNKTNCKEIRTNFLGL